jgi:Leucine-rich repeat (LRR) protein
MMFGPRVRACRFFSRGRSTRRLVAAALLCLPWGAALPASNTDWIEDLGGAVKRDASGEVTGVDLRAAWVTDTDLRKLTQFPKLTHLDLSLTRITDQGMQEIKGLPGIVDLNLRFAEYVTDEGLAAVKEWKNLKRLNVHGTKISDTTLDHVSGIPTLEALDVGSSLVTDVGIERLSSLPNLKELTMGGIELGDAGLQALRLLSGLTYLDLNGRQGTDSNVWTIAMSDRGLEALLTLTELRELRFGCTTLGVGREGRRFATVNMMSVTSRWLEQMKTLTKLERLKLQGCDRVDDESMKVLAEFPSLKEVDLKGSVVTEKGIAILRAAKPDVQIHSGPWEAAAAAFRNN